MAQKYFTLVWRIKNFSYYWQKNDRVEIMSPEFQVNYTTGSTKFRFLLSDLEDFDDRLISKYDKRIKLDLQGTDENVQHSFSHDIFISFVKNDKSVFTWNAYNPQIITAFSNLLDILVSQCDELLADDILTIRCKMTNENLVEGQCFAQTLLALKSMHFVAVIKKFSDLIPGLKRIVEIKSTSDQQPIFSVNVCLLDDGNIDITIPVEDDDIHLCFCQILVLHNSGNWEKCGQDSEWRKYGEVCKFPLTLDFKTLNDKQNYLQNDVVTLKCDVTYSTEAEPQRIQIINNGLDSSEILPQISPCVKNIAALEEKKGNMPSSSTLSGDLASLFEKGILCDTNLQTKTETFPAHKAVLSAISPVFKKMFTNNMSEKTTDCVHIKDLDPDTVRKFLEFIYTDKVDFTDWQNAKKLYFAADKYQIVSLKLKCSSFLKLNIRPSNCCDVLLLSDMHQDTDLKRFHHQTGPGCVWI